MLKELKKEGQEQMWKRSVAEVRKDKDNKAEDRRWEEGAWRMRRRNELKDEGKEEAGKRHAKEVQ